MKKVILLITGIFLTSLSMEGQMSQQEILLSQYRILDEATRYDNLIPFEVQQRIIEPAQPLVIRPPFRPPFRPPVINNIKINNNIRVNNINVNFNNIKLNNTSPANTWSNSLNIDYKYK